MCPTIFVFSIVDYPRIRPQHFCTFRHGWVHDTESGALTIMVEEVMLIQNLIEAYMSSCLGEPQLEIIELHAKFLLADKFKEGLLSLY